MIGIKIEKINKFLKIAFYFKNANRCILNFINQINIILTK